MTVSTVLYAVGIAVIFGAVALSMAWSARRDWRIGREQGDGATMLSAVEQWWPTILAGLVAVAGPMVVLLNG